MASLGAAGVGATVAARGHLCLGLMDTATCPARSMCLEQPFSRDVGKDSAVRPLGRDSSAWDTSEQAGAPLSVPWTPKGTFVVA